MFSIGQSLPTGQRCGEASSIDQAQHLGEMCSFTGFSMRRELQRFRVTASWIELIHSGV
jgi:hypothetical protein